MVNHVNTVDIRFLVAETQMAQIIPERVSAQIEGDFVVFLIGMRINKWWKLHKWVPTALAMSGMQKELRNMPVEQSGCLGTNLISPGMTVQYWRSFDHLEAYARDTSKKHMPAWAKFNKAAKTARGDVGIWHETFLVKEGCYETLYSGMPRHGLGKASNVLPATGSKTHARGRVFGTDETKASTTQ